MSASSVFAALAPSEQGALLAFFQLAETDAARCADLMSTDEDHLSVAGDQLLGLGVTLHASRVCKTVLGDEIHASATSMKVFGENDTIAHFVRHALFAGASTVCNTRNHHVVGQLFEALLAISSLYTTRKNDSGNGVDRLRVTDQIVGDYIERLLRSVCTTLKSQVPLPEIRRRLQNDITNIRGLLQAASAAAAQAAAAAAQEALVVKSTDDYYAWCQGVVVNASVASEQQQVKSRPSGGGQHPAVRIAYTTRAGADAEIVVRMCCGQLASACRCDPAVPPVIAHQGRLLLERLSKSAAIKSNPIARWSCCRAVVVDTAVGGGVTVHPVLECKPSALAAAAAAAAQGCEKAVAASGEASQPQPQLQE